MKRRSTPITLVPHYMQQFACIGSSCEDSCCVGWKVTIDEDTYKKYRQVRDAEMTFQLQKRVTRNRSTPSQQNFAKIKMEKDGSCPMLNEEKLCSIQLKLGEEYLSNTCATYPRTTQNVNGVLERAATVSCPEIARLALLNPNGIDFDEIVEPSGTRYGRIPSLDTSDKSLDASAKKYLWELRIFTIQVLQNRNYSLSDRLILLGMFYQKASSLEESKAVDQIPGMITSYSNIIEEGTLRDDLAAVPAKQTMQLELLKEIVDARFKIGISNKRFLESYAEMMKGLGYVTGEELSGVPEKYNEAYKAYFKPFNEEHEYIFENYLVNYVFKNLFPFVTPTSLYDNYVMMVVHYSLIKLLLIGVGAFHKELTTDHAVKVIQSYSKMFEHNPLVLRRLLSLLKDSGYTSTPYMAILIKN
ncbi:flagellin lysine-N-methylase [Paenibacillus sp. 1P07SE]|uniref:flagellin lysine-N-methylase n=1 Tax=Paenibacillus sp. 1P07SE TaxID=3132209 RepID=UPI0039A67C0E